MQMTWIEVASDAVKIGLGALVGAIATVVSIYLTHKNKKNEEYTTRRRDMLEELMPFFDNASRDGLNIIAITLNDHIDYYKDNPEVDEIKGSVPSPFTVVGQLNEIESKLILIGFSELAKKIDRFGNVFMRNNNENRDSKDAMLACVAELDELRYEVLSELSRCYKDA